MAWVYILKRSSGRHYIGSAVDLAARFANICAVTPLAQSGLVVIRNSCEERDRPFAGTAQDRAIAKAKNNPKLAIFYLRKL
jgi:hypothetical protein